MIRIAATDSIEKQFQTCLASGSPELHSLHHLRVRHVC